MVNSFYTNKCIYIFDIKPPFFLSFLFPINLYTGNMQLNHVIGIIYMNSKMYECLQLIVKLYIFLCDLPHKNVTSQTIIWCTVIEVTKSHWLLNAKNHEYSANEFKSNANIYFILTHKLKSIRKRCFKKEKKSIWFIKLPVRKWIHCLLLLNVINIRECTKRDSQHIWIHAIRPTMLCLNLM